MQRSYRFEQLGELRPSEVRHGFQPGEQGPSGRDSLKMPLAQVQQGRPKVEFLVELRDEQVGADDFVHVRQLDVPDDIDEPFELLLSLRHPKEVDLLAGCSLGFVGAEDDVF